MQLVEDSGKPSEHEAASSCAWTILSKASKKGHEKRLPTMIPGTGPNRSCTKTVLAISDPALAQGLKTPTTLAFAGEGMAGS